jgi:hypothetical protein
MPRPAWWWAEVGCRRPGVLERLTTRRLFGHERGVFVTETVMNELGRLLLRLGVLVDDLLDGVGVNRGTLAGPIRHVGFHSGLGTGPVDF